MRPGSEARGRGTTGLGKLAAVSAVLALSLVPGLRGTAAGASATVETVTYTPQTFEFKVSPDGLFSGDNSITFRLSRTDGAENCRKIGELVVGHDPEPLFGTVHPGDYIVGRRVLDPPLCTFRNVEVSGSPFLIEDINSICYETPTREVPGSRVPMGSPTFMAGRSSVIGRELTVAFHLGPNQPFRTAVPRKKVYLQASVQCVERPVSGSVGPAWDRRDTVQAAETTGGTSPVPTAGSGYSGRQFTPVDPRTPPGTPAGGTSAQPEAVPRDPRTVPWVPAGTGGTTPGYTPPREPGTPPGSAGGSAQPEPACRMDGTWSQENRISWNFNPDVLSVTKYFVKVEWDTSSLPVGLPPQAQVQACNDSAAFLNGSQLRVYCPGSSPPLGPQPTFFEGTANNTCNQVTGVMYNSNGTNQPVTLSRVRNLRVPVPNP